MKASEKEDLFTNLFVEQRARIYRLCQAYLFDKDDVEDLFQEIMINVWNNLESFRGMSKISTWIYRIAVNTALLYNKKAKKKRNLFIQLSPGIYPSDEIEDGSSNQENNHQIKNLHTCINTLKKEDRIIISMVLEGLKYDEIAEVTGLTANHVGVKINRIKPVLLKLMKEVRNG